MKIKMIPGEYNAELVKTIQKLAAENDIEALDELEDEYGRDAVMDALYYACAAKEEALADQEQYFNDLLKDDEYTYYVERFFFS